MHSYVYGEALKNNEIEFFKPSVNALKVATYKGMAVIIDDNLTPAAGVYTTIIFGFGAIGFAVAGPRTGYGAELHCLPSAGNGGGQTTLHSRFNVGIHPLGYAWNDGTGTNAIAGDSPAIACWADPGMKSRQGPISINEEKRDSFTGTKRGDFPSPPSHTGSRGRHCTLVLAVTYRTFLESFDWKPTSTPMEVAVAAGPVAPICIPRLAAGPCQVDPSVDAITIISLPRSLAP
jgi:hypothetical protein